MFSWSENSLRGPEFVFYAMLNMVSLLHLDLSSHRLCLEVLSQRTGRKEPMQWWMKLSEWLCI